MNKRLIAVLGALALSLVVVGCGDSDSSADSITKAEFIEKADEACAESNKEVEADFALYLAENEANLGKNIPTAWAGEMVETILAPAVEREVEVIRSLGVPSGDEAQVSGLLQGLEAGLQKAEANPTLILRETDEAFSEAIRAAKQYGLKVCGI